MICGSPKKVLFPVRYCHGSVHVVNFGSYFVSLVFGLNFKIWISSVDK